MSPRFLETGFHCRSHFQARPGKDQIEWVTLVFLRVAEEGRIPFDVAVPNRATRKAIDELKAGKGKRFNSADALFKDLGL